MLSSNAPNKPRRLDFVEYGILMAYAASGRATCLRARVGCALFNSKKVVVATGYNGAPPGMPQCDQIGCDVKDDHCMRVRHAEQNAFTFAGRRDLQTGYAFTTIRPCIKCLQYYMEAKIKYAYYLKDYPKGSVVDLTMRKLCRSSGIELKRVEPGTNLRMILDMLQKFHNHPGGLFYDE